jgi:hypothetical protein
MLRQLTAIGFALALVGTAHAETQVKINPVGKSSKQLHAELYQAAKRVCAETDAYYLASESACVDLTYQNALAQLHGRASVRKVNYVAQTNEAALPLARRP